MQPWIEAHKNWFLLLLKSAHAAMDLNPQVLVPTAA